MEKVKFGVIGMGHIGKRHAEMILRNSSCQLVAICDIIIKENLGLENYNIPFFNDHIELVSSHPEIDVVCICYSHLYMP